MLTILTISCNDSKTTKIGITEKTDTVSKTNLSPEKPELKTDSVKNIDIGYPDTYEKLPKLTFETITEKEFLSLEPIKPMQIFKP